MLFLGIDVGTSGIRAVVINGQHKVIAQTQQALAPSLPWMLDNQTIGFSQQPQQWWSVLTSVLGQLAEELSARSHFSLKDINSLAIDGTSGTVLLANSNGEPCSEALMYNDQRAILEAQLISTQAPPDTAAIGPTSGLAKVLWLFQQTDNKQKITYALNQADWLSGRFMENFGHSDPNNALKMGYDACQNDWPLWLKDLFKQQSVPADILPQVHLPGEIIGRISPQWAEKFGFRPELAVCAGTTDSTAAILATGVVNAREAVTSLGSTLVMKVIADKPVFNARYGVYSQPYGDRWLVGGSSSSGGAVLKSLFCPGEISDYSQRLLEKIEQGKFKFLNLNYYPLLMPGERFPVQDPHQQPVLSPRPTDDLDFFQAILEGIADIEARAYALLLELGAPYPKMVCSIGGGAYNRAWQYIREQKIAVPVQLARQQEAAAGAALLAGRHFINQ